MEVLCLRCIAAKQAASPELGQQHPNTLASRHLLAQVLDKLSVAQNALHKSCPMMQDKSAGEEATVDRMA